MTNIWLLTCDRTGKFWRRASLRECEIAALENGLKDYTITTDGSK